MTPEQRGLEFLGKLFIAFIIILMGIISFGGIVDIISNGIKKPIPTGGNVWKNWDYSRSAQDVKSYDYNNHTVTYRDYRSSQMQTPSTGTGEKRTVLWSWSPQKKTKVTIQNGEMEIPVRIDLEDLMRNLPEHSQQDLIQSVMDNVDYNDLLDYYGSPELR